ncbi:MAG: acyl-CoA reductase [Flavobacteriales bacterium]|nr:acyl-CoA reductase [Flavobacteriales bacterium]
MKTIDRTTVTLQDRIAALSQLGNVMGLIGRNEAWPGHASGLNEEEYAQLDTEVRRAHQANGWMTEENVRHAFLAWSEVLKRAPLEEWTAAYPELAAHRSTERTVGLVLAGNIPLVGLHDVLCVWLSGHRGRVKCSSQDPALIPALVEVLDRFMPGTNERVLFSTGKLGEVDAVIATGSNNTARYFEHYFGHLPRIVRKSRVSVAVLDGTETPEELALLGEDILRYFGLGCRNVAKLYIPADFALDRFFTAIYPWNGIINHNKYGNNYDYTRALWLLDGVQFLENGFVLVKEDVQLPSPVATVFYERYTDRATVDTRLNEHAANIQCVVGHGAVAFGTTQHPALNDYADGVDTLRFLLDLR